jgi:hypothetical protein
MDGFSSGCGGGSVSARTLRNKNAHLLSYAGEKGQAGASRFRDRVQKTNLRRRGDSRVPAALLIWARNVW